MDNVFDALKALRKQPAIRSVPPYFQDPAYISALASSVQAHHATLGWTPEVTITSLHGLPQAFVDKGDPYQDHCEKTVGKLRDALGMTKKQLLLTYQSSSGRAEWLTPDTEQTLVSLAKSGVRNVTVLTPGFAADCVETLEEIRIRAAETFLNAGGENFSLIPSLNDSNISIAMLCELIDANLKGWA